MKSPLRILHLEDDPNDAALVESTLKAGGVDCEIIRVETQNAFVAALEQGGVDLILSDFSLPVFDGTSAMEIAQAKCPNVPFIFVSGTLGEEQAIESLKSGATDYVLKEHLLRLVPAVHRVMLEVEALSKHRRLEEEVRENEIKFRTLFEVAKDAIFLLRQGLFVDCNASGLKLLGVTREQLIGQSPARFSPTTQPDGRDSREKSMEIIQGALAGEPQYFEWVHHRPDGTTVDVEVSINRFELRGEPYLQSIAHDITERKRAEAALVETSELLETLLKNTTDNIYFKDLQCRVVRFSQTFVDHTRVNDPAELYGKTDFDFYTREHAQAAFEDEQKIMREGIPMLNLEEKEIHLDGTVTWALASKVPWRDKEGKIIGTWGISRDITERKRAEAALMETSELLETLLKNTSDHIYFKDLAGYTVRCSQECLRHVGLSAEAEMLGKTDFDFYSHEVALRAFEDEQKIVLEGKPMLNLEERQTLSDGSVRWVLTSKTPWRDKEGKIIGIWGISKDITERKRIEARFRRLVDSNAQGVIFWNTKGEITGANDAFLCMVDRTRGEMEAGGINWTAMTPPEFAYLDRHSLEEIAAKGVTAPYEKEFIRKDGVRVPILIGAAIFEDNPNEGVAFVLNLTDHKRATEQIVEQAALLDEAQDAIIVRELDGKIIFWNKGAERLYGWSRQEVIGRDIGEFLPTDLKTFAEITALTIKQGRWTGERQHHTKDQREITIEARWTLIRDHQGRPKSILAINTDITEKKKIEAQFMRAQRMESIGTLAGGIAHDLNNILAPIMMSIDILKTTADDPQTKEILNAIEVSAKRGADIVRQVLSFARGLEAERIEVQPKHLLKDLENIIKDTFPKDIRLQFSVPNNTWTILGDPTQVHQILLNLSVNARDAMPNGGHLTIRVENCELDEHYVTMNPQARPGRYVCIKVIDSGSGMPPELVDKIFEPFFTTKELNKGTGLGLSTVMAIVKSHDGILHVDSVPGKGTTFAVYLPAMEFSSEDLKNQTQPINSPRGKGETVLVVDDEASVVTITTQTLQAFGYRVLVATDGAEAVAIYAEHKNEISLVLTDMAMPLMDGAATIHALKRINPAVKILAASGHNANTAEAKAFGAGVKHFLTKPFTARTLLKTVRAILDEA